MLVTRSTLQPIHDLIRAVRDIIRTGTHRDARAGRRRTGDAVDELSALFNTMLDRINGLIAAMGSRSTTSRTICARRSPGCAASPSARCSPATPTEQREALADCLEESDRILSMLNTLMDISEAETGVMQLHARAGRRSRALLARGGRAVSKTSPRRRR